MFEDVTNALLATLLPLQAVRESPPWAVDAWGLGCLMQELYSGHPLARMEDLRNTEPVPKELLQYYQVGDAWTPCCVLRTAVRSDQASTQRMMCYEWRVSLCACGESESRPGVALDGVLVSRWTAEFVSESVKLVCA